MKKIDLLSLVQAKGSLSVMGYAKYLKHYGIKIRDSEIEDLQALIKNLVSQLDLGITSGFYVGYTIPQIGKEFDLLRFSDDVVINLELKRESTEQKIRTQLRRNKYYLRYIDRKIYNLTFVSSTGILYLLNEAEEIETVEFSFLIALLNSNSLETNRTADSLFNPSDYLVSPFNSTDKFLDRKYFLTNQQEDIKSKILNAYSDEKGPIFFAIEGSAGTGKSLLAYDIVNEIKVSGKTALIIHCGILNSGHELLIEKGWDIIAIRSFATVNLSEYAFICIDEAQRIYPHQLEKIIKEIELNKSYCVFSYDEMQTLGAAEAANDIGGSIRNISDIRKFLLSRKVRSNKEIAAFIKLLFNNTRKLYFPNKDNIELNFFSTPNEAKGYLNAIQNLGWEVLTFTPSLHDVEFHERYLTNTSNSSHRVIGQEFDNVVITLDSFFKYDDSGELVYQGRAYYPPVKMLFQNITRTRRRLNLVIINNEELLDRCLSILEK